MLFGALREEAGASEIEWALQAGARVADLLDAVADRWPSVASLGDRLRVSVDFESATHLNKLARTIKF